VVECLKGGWPAEPPKTPVAEASKATPETSYRPPEALARCGGLSVASGDIRRPPATKKQVPDNAQHLLVILSTWYFSFGIALMPKSGYLPTQCCFFSKNFIFPGPCCATAAGWRYRQWLRRHQSSRYAPGGL
jgi:hypothetical protein